MSKPLKKSIAKPSELSFIHYLEKMLKESPPRLKGERTRARLMIATAKMLEKHGYHALRVKDITESSGLAEGSFYVYFKDKKDASLATLSLFLTDFINSVAPLEEIGVSFELIQRANRRWFAICRANAGIMRCVFQLGDQDPDFANLVQKINYDWYILIAGNLDINLDNSNKQATLMAIYFMGSMMDEIVRKLIVFPDKEFKKVITSLSADDNTVADAASLIWMRVFGSDGEGPSNLAPAAKDLAKIMKL